MDLGAPTLTGKISKSVCIRVPLALIYTTEVFKVGVKTVSGIKRLFKTTSGVASP